jgi:alginate O-acetyltransferase complex protein AlgI
MVFSSVSFLFLFLPAVLLLFYGANPRLRFPVLLASSLAFYAYGENYLIWVMLATTLIDYACGLMIAGASPGPLEPGSPRSASQRAWLAVSIVSNLGLLCYFKYFNFFADSAAAALSAAGLRTPALEGTARIALPLGISFYTFQSMSYTIDVYRGQVAATRSLLVFSTFVTMFPQLVAGPIVRYSDIEGQLARPRETIGRFAEGVRRFVGGLAKKALIANPLGEVADRIFALDDPSVTAVAAWAGIAAYTLQIYFDFSGYSCMAIGLGKMFGFDFPENFRHPYAARSVRDFWHRWHITLSTWFRDYLYIPLGGSRGSERRTWRNLLVVFLACGLWHGASWTFVAWGLFHGLFLGLERTRFGSVVGSLPRFLQTAYVMLVVMAGWVLFRSDSVSGAAAFLGRLVRPGPADGRSALEFVTPEAAIAMGAGAVLSAPLVPWLRARLDACCGVPRAAGEIAWMASLAVLFFASVACLLSGSYNPFIYFRF